MRSPISCSQILFSGSLLRAMSAALLCWWYWKSPGHGSLRSMQKQTTILPQNLAGSWILVWHSSSHSWHSRWSLVCSLVTHTRQWARNWYGVSNNILDATALGVLHFDTQFSYFHIQCWFHKMKIKRPSHRLYCFLSSYCSSWYTDVSNVSVIQVHWTNNYASEELNKRKC